MSWFKVDDMLAFNSKVVIAGNEAIGLWVRAGSWCASQLRGGFIPTAMANAMRSPMANGADVDALVKSGLWLEVAGGFEFHDWDEYQPNADDTERRRIIRSEAGKRGADARWGRPVGDGKRNGKRNGNRIADPNGKTMAKICPVPVPVVKTLVEASPDVVNMLDYLDSRIVSNGSKKPSRTKTNTDAMRLLIDRDGRSVDEVRNVIAWATSDPFWRSNILSAVKLRAKYDTLRLKAITAPALAGSGRREPGYMTSHMARPASWDEGEAVV